MTDWLVALTELEASAIPHVLVTQIEVMGSAPRENGAKMVITADGLFGSIGGGSLEFQAAAEARGMLTQNKREPKIEKAILGPDMRQCCGGAVTLLFEPFFPAALTLAVFGAGHVAQALVHVLDGVPMHLLWIDERDAIFPADLPRFVRTLSVSDPLTAIVRIPAGAHVLVMTHSHERDFQLIHALVKRDDLSFLGLIGSASKWAQFRHRLSKDGVSDDLIAKVHCPIGLPGLKGKRPTEIAISVAAQLLLDRGAEITE
jgi:xanthine dehydrogenase accessory factor